MQTKVYNAYRITHLNGSTEDINALNPIQALENMEVPETESKVNQLFLIKEGVKTLIEDEPTEIIFSAVASDNNGGSIATPASGRIHVGDSIALKAIPARNYMFIGWTLNGNFLSNEASLVYTMEALPSGIDTATFVAQFALAPVEWEAEVSPAGAGTAGCLAFPTAGVAQANATIQLLAVAKTGWQFDHWESNGSSLGANEILETTALPLAEGETERKYTAIFTEV